MKRLLILAFIFVFAGCTKDNIFTPKENIEISIDARLPKDVNGYSYFKLYSSETQNLHTISGSIRINGKIPDEPRVKVEWENNLYWNLKQGDTISTITKTYLNYYTGQFVVISLPPLISNINALVPTINKSCYNSSDGTINTVIAPKWEMRGDTMIVVVRYKSIIKTERIILK
jgi:hypothetical protein